MKLAYVIKFVADMNRAGLPQYSRCPSHVPQLSISWRVGRKRPHNRQLDYDTPAIQPTLFGAVFIGRPGSVLTGNGSTKRE
jgi:hypothetical protein